VECIRFEGAQEEQTWSKMPNEHPPNDGRVLGWGINTVTTIAPEAATPDKGPPRSSGAARTLVIFGAGGDLTKRLVVPALYHLVQPADFQTSLPLLVLIIMTDDRAMATRA